MDLSPEPESSESCSMKDNRNMEGFIPHSLIRNPLYKEEVDDGTIRFNKPCAI